MIAWRLHSGCAAIAERLRCNCADAIHGVSGASETTLLYFTLYTGSAYWLDQAYTTEEAAR